MRRLFVEVTIIGDPESERGDTVVAENLEDAGVLVAADLKGVKGRILGPLELWGG